MRRKSWSAARVKLVTIGFSHFCEKARWAVDRSGVTYTETSHAPLAHIWAVFRARGNRTVPVLVTDDGVFGDSTDILKYVDPFLPEDARLYPEEPAARREVEELEDLFDRKLGPRARRWAYSWLVYERPIVARLFEASMTPREKKISPLLVSAAIVAIKQSMRITPALRDSEFAKLLEMYEALDERLSRGAFLVGDKFSAADLTLAALSAPLVVPPENPWMPNLAEAPAKMQEQIEAFRATKAGAHVLALYRDERSRRFPGKIS
jgi:glutathione S-transferase